MLLTEYRREAQEFVDASVEELRPLIESLRKLPSVEFIAFAQSDALRIFMDSWALVAHSIRTTRRVVESMSDESAAIFAPLLELNDEYEELVEQLLDLRSVLEPEDGVGEDSSELIPHEEVRRRHG